MSPKLTFARKLFGLGKKHKAVGSTDTTREKYGLFELHVPVPKEECNIDIVAVHGLNGDWESTWTDKNGTDTKLWLRDFLPKKFPGARIMSFGYDAAVALSTSVSSIDAAATSLLDAIHGARQKADERRRPIIFIAHSLGGIIVKKTIILAHQRSDLYQDLVATLDSAAGVVFFAVPHRGADLGYWAALATKALSFVTVGALGNPNFVEGLTRNSAEFAGISKAFVQPASKFVVIRSFYEQIKIGNQVIVDEDSATLGLSSERAVAVLGANHRDICKFRSADTQKYKVVQNAMEQMVAELARPSYASYMNFGHRCFQKAFADWQTVIEGSSSAKEDSKWILHMSQYRSWSDGSRVRLLFVEYAMPMAWQASLGKVFGKDIQALDVGIISFVYYPSKPPSNSMLPRPSGEEADLRSLLPRELLGQIIASHPQCLSSLDEIQKKMQDRPADSWQEIGDGKVTSWKSSLFSPTAKWQHLWSLLACALISLTKDYVVLLVGFDNNAHETLLNGLYYMQAVFSGESGSAYGMALCQARHKILVIGDQFSPHLPTKFKEISAKIDEESEAQECLTSLYFPELHARRDRVEKSERGTNQWIWDHPVYTEWKAKRSGLLWIYGKPGSGKSTLAAEIQRSLCAGKAELSFIAADRRQMTADFFYSSRGGILESSNTLMLRSVLYQLIQQKPRPAYLLSQSLFRRLRARHSGDIAWSFNSLQQMLLTLARSDVLGSTSRGEKSGSFLLILDGLDEAEQSRHGVLSMISELTKTDCPTGFKVIALSRVEPDIRKALNTQFTIDMKSVNDDDIQRIVRIGMARLWRHIISQEDGQRVKSSGFPMSNTFSDSDDSSQEANVETTSRRLSQSSELDDQDEIIHKASIFPEIPELDTVRNPILEHADGVILWVVMVIRRLIEIAKSRPCTIAELEASVGETPKSLTRLYRTILERLLEESDGKLLHYVLSWLCFSDRTLELGEMRDIMAMYHWSPRSQESFQGFLDKNRLGQWTTKSWKPTQTYLQDLSGGLVEVVPADPRPTNGITTKWSKGYHVSSSDNVQLIHTTAKEFLTSGWSPIDLRGSKSLAMISNACIEYLMGTFPLYGPAAQRLALIYRSEEGESEGLLAFVALLEDRPLLAYILEQLPRHLHDERLRGIDENACRSKFFQYLTSVASDTRSLTGYILWTWATQKQDIMLHDTVSAEDLRSVLARENLDVRLFHPQPVTQDSASPATKFLLGSWPSSHNEFLDKCFRHASEKGLLNAKRVLLDLGAGRAAL